MRRKLAVLLVASLALVGLACSPEEQASWTAINDFRHANGVAQLAWDEAAHVKAKAWSHEMARAGRLSHSVLSDGLPAGWRYLGENVAMNTSIEGAMRALEASPGHRANLLNPRFTKVGVGVVKSGQYYWVTEVFIG